MTNNWKENLASFFEGYRIIERSKDDTLKNFYQFCEFVAEPAFESLQEELKKYRVPSKIKKSKGRAITFQINFPNSRIENFLYSIRFPRNSIELMLKLNIRGRSSKKSTLEEREHPFMKDIVPMEVLKIKIEDLIQDVIEHYRNFCFESATKIE
ncbi:MAG: hypothetical protein JXB23_18220 [Candidatus Aminicenantes bacterium]|nr:hypothetical protein [Candidatus Aminicenantes bacterium]